MVPKTLRRHAAGELSRARWPALRLHLWCPRCRSGAQRRASGKRSEPEAIWACTVHPGAVEDGKGDPLATKETRTLVLVERSFEEPVTFDDLQATQNKCMSCFNLRDVRSIRSYLSTDRHRMICLYQAPDADAVGQANRLADLPFDRLWPAKLISSMGVASH